MANARKLQAEIDTTMKTIDEGLAEFDGLKAQVSACDAPQLKMKLEDELKRELKKLQKHRDAVKMWSSSGDVKDKSKLVEAKANIERRMEAFKVIERESKTKTYSKEGLMRGTDLTPEEKRRRLTTDWLDKLLERLNDESEAWEKEQEALEEEEGASGGGGKKKTLEKSRVEILALALTTHRFHVEKLERIRELVDAGRMDCDVVDGVKGAWRGHGRRARARARTPFGGSRTFF